MKNPASDLLKWYAIEARDLPWRNSSDPYRIWLSEVILQQTRIDQGQAYFERFVTAFPDVKALANAETDEVMKLWEGLGYYSRARNLHHTAKTVANEFEGKFPDSWEQLILLKGIGPYTARAIGSIAFNNQVGVLDGNVFRVLSRFLADYSPIDAPKTRVTFQKILDEWIAAATQLAQENDLPSKFNQGMMDLGATICKPQNPNCEICPLANDCQAFKRGIVSELPQKEKKLKRKAVFQHFFLLKSEAGEILIKRRPPTGIWSNLWEIPNQEVAERDWQQGNLPNFVLRGAFKHVFTHLDLMIKVYEGDQNHSALAAGCKAISVLEIKDYAFSRAVLKIFEQYLY